MSVWTIPQRHTHTSDDPKRLGLFEPCHVQIYNVYVTVSWNISVIQQMVFAEQNDVILDSTSLTFKNVFPKFTEDL